MPVVHASETDQTGSLPVLAGTCESSRNLAVDSERFIHGQRRVVPEAPMAFVVADRGGDVLDVDTASPFQ